jgi:Zn-dependent M28 family amino/carboxypeptidase
MLQAGEPVKMTVDLDVAWQDQDPMAYNTVAEIPGTDLKEEIVMLGGHMDSWHSGTGATDNAAGVSVAMEAVRIIQALGLKPRRTIRVALWSGEEQGLLGSRAYVTKHFGSLQNPATSAAPATDGANANGGGAGNGNGAAPPAPVLVKKADYDKFSAYFNLDNGTGKIRGVYMQGNEAVRPLFRQWLAPFKDMGATTLTISNTSATDHIPFDTVGLPGFQFIQDDIEYDTRTHHSNQDVFDRIQAEDMKQAATIMAAFVYQTAMRDKKLPRKPAPGSR